MENNSIRALRPVLGNLFPRNGYNTTDSTPRMNGPPPNYAIRKFCIAAKPALMAGVRYPAASP